MNLCQNLPKLNLKPLGVASLRQTWELDDVYQLTVVVICIDSYIARFANGTLGHGNYSKQSHTIHPKAYVSCLVCFALLWFQNLATVNYWNWCTHILLGCLNSTWAITLLPVYIKRECFYIDKIYHVKISTCGLILSVRIVLEERLFIRVRYIAAAQKSIKKKKIGIL